MGVVLFEGLRFLRPPFFEMSLFEVTPFFGYLPFLGVSKTCHFLGVSETPPEMSFFDTPFLTPPVFGPLFRGVLFDPPLKKRSTLYIYSFTYPGTFLYTPKRRAFIYGNIPPFS